MTVVFNSRPGSIRYLLQVLSGLEAEFGYPVVDRIELSSAEFSFLDRFQEFVAPSQAATIYGIPVFRERK